MRVLRFGSAALLMVAVFFGAPAGQAPAPELAPAASASPAPAPVSPAVAALRNDLRSAIRAPGWASAQYGVLVVSLDRGDTLFALNPDLPLAPASNMKLYSTAAALYYLGPDFRYSTYVLGNGEIRDSVLHGDLVLFGTGDPTMSGRMLPNSASALRGLADSLLARGVREVQGDVVGDGSYFDDVRLGTGWNPDDLMAWYGAPVGALSFAENIVSVRVLPGGGTGQPARIETAPATQGFAIANEVRTIRSGKTLVRFEHGPEGLVLRGQIARRHPGVARSVPVVDPARYAAAAFRAALDDRGIRVTGEVRSAHDAAQSPVTFAARPAGTANGTRPSVLAIHLSPPLAEIAKVTNHISHNLFAEALLKLIGRVALGDGSFEGGARAVRYMLECEAGVDSAALGIMDGSGLSRLNRVTARTTIQLLDFMARSDAAEPYRASLPEAANPHGTHSLRHRMGRTAAAGNLRAKTGTIRNVSSLSGYVQAANGERLAFSIIANGVPSTWRAKRMEDAVGARLAAFRRPPAELAPPQAIPPETAAPEAAEPENAPASPAAPTVQPFAPAPEPIRPAPERRTERAAPTTRTHRVSPGETLDGIARRYETTVEALQEQNPGVTPRRLQIGQELRIPGTNVSGERAREPERPTTTKRPEARTHRVKQGETLDGIARRYGVSVRELQRANPGLNPRRLQIGQTVKIPG